jgi:hypothetical protein
LGRLAEARAVVEQLLTLTQVVVPDLGYFRNPQHRACCRRACDWPPARRREHANRLGILKRIYLSRLEKGASYLRGDHRRASPLCFLGRAGPRRHRCGSRKGERADCLAISL